MYKVYKQVKTFLENPETLEEFWYSKETVWIDWREYDEDIIRYFNEMMEEKLEIQLINNNQTYGNDILLIKGQEQSQIPYEEEMDRDTTIKYLNDFIKPKYEIRWFIESLGNDTLCFVLLKSDEWKMLEEEFEKEKLNHYFTPIDFERKMFDLNVDEVYSLLDLRSKNENLDFSILADWMKILTKEKELKFQKNNGEIDFKNYLRSINMIKKLKSEFIDKHKELRF